MWVPSESCERCGSTEISEFDGSDVSVGYKATEWRCRNCGEICEEWEPEVARKPAMSVTLVNGRVEVNVA